MFARLFSPNSSKKFADLSEFEKIENCIDVLESARDEFKHECESSAWIGIGAGFLYAQSESSTSKNFALFGLCLSAVNLLFAFPQLERATLSTALSGDKLTRVLQFAKDNKLQIQPNTQINNAIRRMKNFRTHWLDNHYGKTQPQSPKSKST